MWNEPSLEELSKIPDLYETEHVPARKKFIHMHFFLGGCDWYAAEYSSEERIFFGYVNLNDPGNAEWGYFAFDELRDLKTPGGIETDRDLYWKPRRVEEIPELLKILKYREE